MSRENLDWEFLRTGVVLPLVALGLAVCLFVGSTIWRNAAEAASRTSFEELTSLEQESIELRRRRETLESYREAYSQLQAAGFIADENRLEWIDALRTSADDLGLPYLRYSVDAQRRFDDPLLEGESTTSVRGSAMELQVGLVHEVDLLRLIDRLADAPGVFVVTGCLLRWIGQSELPSAAASNISAECELEWLTIPSRM